MVAEYVSDWQTKAFDLRDTLKAELDRAFARDFPEARKYAHERAGNIAGWIFYRDIAAHGSMRQQLRRCLCAILDYTDFVGGPNRDRTEVLHRIADRLDLVIRQWSRSNDNVILTD